MKIRGSCSPFAVRLSLLSGGLPESKQRRTTSEQRFLFYPANFAIIENSGMYREMTMPRWSRRAGR